MNDKIYFTVKSKSTNRFLRASRKINTPSWNKNPMLFNDVDEIKNWLEDLNIVGTHHGEDHHDAGSRVEGFEILDSDLEICEVIITPIIDALGEV